MLYAMLYAVNNNSHKDRRNTVAREIKVMVRLDDEEMKRLKRLAKKLNMPPATYMRFLLQRAK